MNLERLKIDAGEIAVSFAALCSADWNMLSVHYQAGVPQDRLLDQQKTCSAPDVLYNRALLGSTQDIIAITRISCQG